MPRRTHYPDPIPPDQRLLTREQTAQRLGVSTSTVDRLRYSGRLHAVRVGGRVMFDPDMLGALVASGGVSLRPESDG